MKRVFKDERDIVEHASCIKDAEVCFYPAESDLSHRFLASIRSGSFGQRERPDFEDTVASLLLEAMVVDDHPRPGMKDRTRARESKVFRELQAAGFDVHHDARLIAAVSSGLPTDQDHNYRGYVEHFTRVVLDHGGKGAAYRAERPGCDLGFLILDESTAYFESYDRSGQLGTDRPHFWFADAAFADVTTRSGADCVIWLTPYKRLLRDEARALPLPTMTIVDVRMLDQEEHLVYDADRMISSEK